MTRVAYLTGRAWRGEPLSGLPDVETADHALLAAACARRGIALDVRFWDDPALAAEGFAAAIVRSCWDYSNDPTRFVAALAGLETAGVRVLNPPAAIAWNSAKRYLDSLASAGVATIPTVWADRLEPLAVARAFEAFNAAEIVAKPQVGAGGVRTIRLKRGAWGEGSLAEGPLGPVMLQPFLPEVESAGEASLFFFGGRFSHAVRKRPPAGGWLANAKDAHFAAAAATPAEIRLAQAALAAAPQGLLYARVDMLEGAAGPVLIEFEAIEPRLFLSYAPAAADNLADALTVALASRA